MRLDSPSTAIRLLAVGLIWLTMGAVSYFNYETDACPPEVKEREARFAALLSPVVMAAHASACVRSTPWEVVVGMGFLGGVACFFLGVFRAKTTGGFLLSAGSLRLMTGLGFYCTLWSNSHSGG